MIPDVQSRLLWRLCLWGMRFAGRARVRGCLFHSFFAIGFAIALNFAAMGPGMALPRSAHV